MDFDSILREMEKERQKAFEIRKKESSKDKEKQEHEHENVQEEDEDRRDDTSKEDEKERTEDEDSEHEEIEEEKEEHEETDHDESEEQGESEEKDNEDDEVKEEEHEEPEHVESEKQEEKEESEDVEEDTKKDKEENEETEHDETEEQEEKEENPENVVKEETETKVETLENVTEKTKPLKTPQPPISSAKPKIKHKLQSIKLNSTQTKSIIKQKDVIKMPKKINAPKKTKIIKTIKIKRVIKQPITAAKKIKKIALGASSSAEIKRLAKDVARLKEVLDKLLKQQKENYTISLRKQKEKEIETIRKNKEKEIEAIKRDKEKEASASRRHAELKNELNKSAKKEDLSKESQILANEVDKVRKDIAYLKEFQPEILFSSIQKLNENITEMNSLFRLAAELMQKPDPVQSKLKKLFDENEKIAQGILTVLDAVNEIKQFGTREVEDIRRIEEEIRLPLKEIASRKQTDDMEAPSIPAPPPEFRETSSDGDSFSFGSSDISGISRETTDKNKSPFEAEDTELPLPPEMTPIPTSTGAPIPPESFQSFGQQAQSSAIRPAQPSQFSSARALPTNRSSAFSNELPPSPTEFTQEQLDQLASMVPPLPRPTTVQFPPQRMQQPSQTQFQARQPQQPQQRSARFVRKKEELKM